MWPLLLGFLRALLTGEAMRVWKQHKVNEAAQAQNDAQAMSGAQAQKEMDKWRR